MDEHLSDDFEIKMSIIFFRTIVILRFFLLNFILNEQAIATRQRQKRLKLL